ncbi:MAG: MMCAP2_0565 family pilin-like conjugal transfer protein [Candidatus Saccharimonadales bacterium]
MSKQQRIKFLAVYVASGLPIVLAHPAFAAETAGVASVESFIKSIITVVAGLAGLVATGFLVVGGFSYITSSGNPEHLDRAKRTITFSMIGLAITIGAFVISQIVTSLASKAFGN